MFAQSVFQIPTNHWKIIKEDKAEFKNPEFNDSSWQNIAVPAKWTETSVGMYHGFAWYRVSFDLPANFQKEDLMLELGTIDACDETFFNGEKIGATGKMPPNDQSAWDRQRNYVIPKSLLKSHNVLAIRVYHAGAFGGLYKGKLSLTQLKEYNDLKAKAKLNKNSYHQLTTSNGLISAVYNAETNEIEAVYPHIFAQIDSTNSVKPFINNLKTNRTDKPISVGYKENTHIIEVKYKDLTINYFASFVNEDKVLYAEVTGRKDIIENFNFIFNEKNLNYEKTSDLSFIVKNNIKRIYSFSEINVNNKKINTDLCFNELAFMRNLINKAKIPATISVAERNVMEQAVSVLKMSQVSDKDELPLSHGQVLASLRPGVWAISWVRDGTFAISAMAKLGMYDEAKKGLEFMLKAKGNRFKNYIFRDGKNYGPEIDYQISLTRYFGDGTEECDFNENGPNIEYDDWGLFLIAFADYINESQDWEFFRKWQPLVTQKIGDPLLFIIQENNLLKRDSGPWEHHLPGRQFAFTNGVASVGLSKLAELLQHENLDFQKYKDASQRIYDGVMKNMWMENRYVKGNANDFSPEDHYYFDGATFELFASQFIKDKSMFVSHMNEYNKHLKVNEKYGKDRGYIRFNSEDSYENQEWPFANLRVAVAQNHFGLKQDAKKNIDRITSFAEKNYNLIPEIITNDEEAYSGAIPMVGYGSDAYVLAILEYYNK